MLDVGDAHTESSLLVRLYMVDHVAHLARLDIASEAAQKLVGAACSLVDNEVLGEPHVARVGAEPIPDPATLDNGFLEGGGGNLTAEDSYRPSNHCFGIICHLGASHGLGCTSIACGRSEEQVLVHGGHRVRALGHTTVRGSWLHDGGARRVLPQQLLALEDNGRCHLGVGWLRRGCHIQFFFFDRI